MSCCLSTKALTQELEKETISSSLVLPKPEILKVNNVKMLAFTPEGYSIILQMYTAYQLYIDAKMEYEEINYHFETELELCSERLELKEEAILVIAEDREFVYKTADKAMKNFEKQQKRNKIRTILFASGGVFAGIGIGILVGFFIAQ